MDQHQAKINDAHSFPLLRIVIVNWNTGDRLLNCLESIAGTQHAAHTLERVVIVDNASVDGSQNLSNDFGLPLEIIQNDRNTGFAFACNQGAEGSDSDYILFLNPDTTLDENSLDEPVRFLEKDLGTGICGIQLRDEMGHVSRSCARFPQARHLISKSLGLNKISPTAFPTFQMTEWDHLQSSQVDQVIGAFFFIRTSLFKKLDGFDTRFFIYYEDIDISLRAFQSGWRSFYLTSARAFHEGNASSAQVKANRLFYDSRSRILYARKHLSPIAAAAVTFATGGAEPIIRCTTALAQRDLKSVRNVMRGTLWLWRHLILEAIHKTPSATH